MTLTRDSALWWLLLIAGAATFLTGRYDLLTKAFGLTPEWQARIELLGGVATFLAGYLRMSPLALSKDSELANAPADASRTLSITGKASAVLLALGVGAASISACAPKEYHTAVVANTAYAQAVFAVQDAEIASHNAHLISDAKHQDYKRIIAKLLRAGDAVTIALKNWQPGAPMPSIVAGAFKDASDLFADVSALLPTSDPFVGKIRDVLAVLQKFGVIPSAEERSLSWRRAGSRFSDYPPDADAHRTHAENDSGPCRHIMSEMGGAEDADSEPGRAKSDRGASHARFFRAAESVMILPEVIHALILHPAQTRCFMSSWASSYSFARSWLMDCQPSHVASSQLHGRTVLNSRSFSSVNPLRSA